MKNAIIQAIEAKQIKKDIPVFATGDVIKVHLRIVEGKKERIQIFEGIVLRRQGGGLSETITVRKIVDGIGVEKTIPLHTPTISKIEVVKFGKVRRSKLYYLRELVGSKVTRVKEDLQRNIEAAQSRAKVKKEAEAKKLADKAAATEPTAEAATPAA